MHTNRPAPARSTRPDRASRLRALVARTALAAASTVALAACGNSVRIHGTADEAWDRTLAALRAQGVMPAEFPPDVERPRLDRPRGEIDLLHAPSVYYGEGAAFIQVDVDAPLKAFDRSVRMWVDYPVGNNVVRYGRAIDERESERFFLEFKRALESLPPPAPVESTDPATTARD
jgi:hypothetical protein